MRKLYTIIILVVLIAAAAAGIYFYRDAKEPATIEVSRGRISDIRSMVELCTVDIYNEVPIKDTVNKKMIFAIQKQQGSISFDIEQLDIDTTGDTIKVKLPKEIIEIRESTAADSWQVIDTKGLNIFVSDKLTLEEENQVKSRIRERSIRRLYSNGTVKRARAEAAEQLRQLLEAAYRRPVTVEN